MKTIGIIGGGFVGGAVARGWMEHAEVKIFDVLPEKATHTKAEVLECDVIFVCLPTPMGEDGAADLTFLYDFFRSVKGAAKGKPFVIKSTVPPGTTRKIADFFGLPRVMFNPEFLTARCATIDYQCATSHYIGAISTIDDAPNDVADMISHRFRQVCKVVPVEVAESIKYGRNVFFAVKVAFFNEFRQFCEAAGIDWECVLAGILEDGRIAASHCFVPGPDGKWGYGGACLPKDINALMAACREVGVDPKTMAGAWAKNQEVRPE